MNNASPTPAATHDEDGHDDGIGHGTLKGYLTGFALAAILTAIPFWLVMDHVIANPAVTIILILALGVVQLYVHMVYFLHMNAKTEQGWSLTSLAFTLILLVIVLAGSIWVMYWLQTNMMMGPMGH